MNKTRGYWNPLNNTILVDWDGQGNIIKEYRTIVYSNGDVSVYPTSEQASAYVGRGFMSIAFITNCNRNHPDFESKLDAWVRNNRGLLR